MMEDYICQSSDCGETWERSLEGNLIPGCINSGSWQHLSESHNCPACDDFETDWRWVKND